MGQGLSMDLARIGEDRFIATEILKERHHLFPLPVLDDGARSGPVEEIWCDREVPGFRGPPGDVLDVLIHAECLLNDHDRALGWLGGLHFVDPHVAIAGVIRDFSGLNVCHGAETTRVSLLSKMLLGATGTRGKEGVFWPN